jgi:hypothetical protein
MCTSYRKQLAPQGIYIKPNIWYLYQPRLLTAALGQFLEGMRKRRMGLTVYRHVDGHVMGEAGC